MEELSIAFRQAPAVVLMKLKRRYAKDCTIKNFW